MTFWAAVLWLIGWRSAHLCDCKTRISIPRKAKAIECPQCGAIYRNWSGAGWQRSVIPIRRDV